MTTNILEVFNFVLKVIRALPVSEIMDYTFHKCNEYFINRWEKARQSMVKGEHWGEPARKHLLEQCEISTNEVAVLFDPARLVYEVKSSIRTNVGSEISGGRIFRVEIDDVVSCTCMTPTLLHLPCSHVITACRMRHVLHEGSNQISPYYSLSAEEKTWTSRFESLLDPSQWVVYGGRTMSRTWPCERCGRGDGRRGASVMRWTIWRRVTIMICMVRMTSIK
jgi:hypothetical protein